MIGYLVQSHSLDPKIIQNDLKSRNSLRGIFRNHPIRFDPIGSSKDFQVSTPAPHCQWSWQRSPAPGSTLPIGGSRGPRCPHRGYIDSLAHLITSIYFSKLSILGPWDCDNSVYHMFITDEKCENAVLPCVLLRFTTMCVKQQKLQSLVLKRDCVPTSHAFYLLKSTTAASTRRGKIA